LDTVEVVFEMFSSRAEREIQHGRLLAESDPELTWGWGTPAGAVRARRRAELIAEGAGMRPRIRALEIGCGTGMFTEMFAATGAQIVAVDISGELLEKARTRRLPPDRIRFLQKRFEECALDGPFDAIVGSSILHHLDLREALPRIHTLLRPGGLMAFAEPNMLNPQIALQKNIPWLKRLLGDSPDETAFVRWSFRRRLLQAGFEAVIVTPFDWLHPATPASMIPLVSRIGLGLERVPILRELAGSLLIRGQRRTQVPA
jgi:2-polyprenyl-3-methyl-5-hydroxy-6-metoxy-1,4-benzoquinol methylase